MRWRISLAVVLALAVVVSCDQQPVEPQVNEVAATPLFSGQGTPVHKVTMGGADPQCPEPGCDANFSIIAIETANGRVKGQWSDAWGKYYGGLSVHVPVDCLVVDGNEAWVGGTIKNKKVAPGLEVFTKVVDNGKTGDEAAFIWVGYCGDMEDVETKPLIHGQVTVW